MNALTAFIEKRIFPTANKINKNRYLTAIKAAFLRSLPFTIFGALLMVVTGILFAVIGMTLGDNYAVTFQPFVATIPILTFGITVLIISAGIGYNLSNHYKVNPICGAIISLISFLIITPVNSESTSSSILNRVIPIEQIGGEGLFTAMLISCLSIELYRIALQKNWTIKITRDVSKLVSNSIFFLIPVLIPFVLAFTIRWIFSFTFFETLTGFIYQTLQLFLENLDTTLPATLIVAVLGNFFCFFGLNGPGILQKAFEQVWITMSFDNLEARQLGYEAPNIINGSFIDFFVLNSGYIFFPILICLLLFFKKNTEWKKLGKFTLLPGLFGIAEPLMLGLPVILNPMLFFPLLLTPIITTSLSYFAMAIGFVPLTNGIALPSTLPLIISGFLSTYSISGVLLQIVLLILLTMMWYPFLKVIYNHKMMDV